MRPWSQSEDDLLRQKHSEFGPKWAQISPFFNGRSDVALKNRWIAINVRDSFPNARTGSEATSPGLPDESAKPEDGRAQSAIEQPAPPSAKRSSSDPRDFKIAQLLWSINDETDAMKTEAMIEEERPPSSFPNYGGKLW
jgi:hypothetical protein